MGTDGSTSSGMHGNRREIAARLAGAAVALCAMALAWRLLGWPAPAVSVALGFGAYLMARARGK